MFIACVPANALGTNCWIVAANKGGVPGHHAHRECVIIDPGVGVAASVEQICADNKLIPVSVLLTHGHLDHTFSSVPICQGRDIPAYIHPADRGQLADPWSALGMVPGTPLFGAFEFAEPSDVRELSKGAMLLGGLESELGLHTMFAPGHTPGSVVFAAVGNDEEVLFTGDLLFAGSVGRTDLPGGSSAQLHNSLREIVLPASDTTVVRPGHGRSTTVGIERHSNPFLRAAALAPDAETDPAPRSL